MVDFTYCDEDCWLWKGIKSPAGYGQFYDKSLHENIVLAHRLSYKLYKSINIEKGKYICHKCDTPSCVNPSHLFKGSAFDNVRDMFDKGRNPKIDHLGKLNPNSLLKEKDVFTVKRLILEGHTQISVARQFGVSDCCIRDIIKGRSWTHLCLT